MMVDVDAIKNKLRQADVLSGLWGVGPEGDFAAVCEDLTLNEVPGLVAEVERLQGLVKERDGIWHQAITERDEARAEIAELRVTLDNCKQVQDLAIGRLKAGGLEEENERLRGTLTVVADAAELLASKMMIEGTRGHQIAQNIVVSACQALNPSARRTKHP